MNRSPRLSEISLEEQFAKLQAENEKLKTDLAIVYEHTNLAESNSKKTIYEEMLMIRRRTAKYCNLRKTAGPLYEEGKQALKR